MSPADKNSSGSGSDFASTIPSSSFGPTIALTSLAALVLLPWAIGKVRYGYDFRESLVAFYCIAEGGTLYGHQFTEERFRSVELGMSKAEVLELLGEPIVRPWFQGAQGNPSEWWYAFQRQPGMNAHRRCIEFGLDERVSASICEPNVD